MITFREFLDLCEDYNPNAEFVIFNKKTSAVLGTARGFDQAKTKASSIRKQRGLKFDDVSFMTSKRFYGKTSTVPSGGRRIEYSPCYNPIKRGCFKGIWDAQGNFHDLDGILMNKRILVTHQCDVDVRRLTALHNVSNLLGIDLIDCVV